MPENQFSVQVLETFWHRPQLLDSPDFPQSRQFVPRAIVHISINQHGNSTGVHSYSQYSDVGPELRCFPTSVESSLRFRLTAGSRLKSSISHNASPIFNVTAINDALQNTLSLKPPMMKLPQQRRYEVKVVPHFALYLHPLPPTGRSIYPFCWQLEIVGGPLTFTSHLKRFAVASSFDMSTKACGFCASRGKDGPRKTLSVAHRSSFPACSDHATIFSYQFGSFGLLWTSLDSHISRRLNPSPVCIIPGLSLSPDPWLCQ